LPFALMNALRFSTTYCNKRRQTALSRRKEIDNCVFRYENRTASSTKFRFFLIVTIITMLFCLHFSPTRCSCGTREFHLAMKLLEGHQEDLLLFLYSRFGSWPFLLNEGYEH
jgi:hypothetical protein